MNIKQLIAGTAVGCVLGLAVAGAAQAQTLRYAAAAPVLTMDPHATNDFVSQMVISQIYDPLVAVNADLELVSGLAESWEHLGGLKWRFTLRQGVKFHGGQDFSAEDVAFSIERAKTSRFFTAFVGKISSVDIIDSHTVEITTDDPDPLLPRKMSNAFIMSKSWAEENGADEVPDLGAEGSEVFSVRNANGTGLYMLQEREPSVRTVLARNPNYWGEATGNVQEAIYTPIGSGPTRVAALLSGEIDLVADLPLQDIPRVDGADGLMVQQRPQLINIQLELDGSRDVALDVWDKDGNVLTVNPLKDVRVRKAFAQAINVDLIVDRVMRGNAAVAGSAAVPGTGGYYADLDDHWAYDVEAAKGLLAEAGYPDGFQVQLNCPLERYVNAEDICKAVAPMLAQIGVDVRVKGMVWPEFAKLLVNGPDSSFHLIGAGPNGQDTQDTFVDTMMTRVPDIKQGFFNWALWSNDEFDEIATEIQQTFDEARREELYRRGLTLGRENVHAIYLHRQVITWGLRDNITATIRPDATVPLETVVIQ